MASGPTNGVAQLVVKYCNDNSNDAYTPLVYIY